MSHVNEAKIIDDTIIKPPFAPVHRPLDVYSDQCKRPYSVPALMQERRVAVLGAFLREKTGKPLDGHRLKNEVWM